MPSRYDDCATGSCACTCSHKTGCADNHAIRGARCTPRSNAGAQDGYAHRGIAVRN